jgi:uncharacterized SAM-binding protein YcdF (DUF218 family)
MAASLAVIEPPIGRLPRRHPIRRWVTAGAAAAAIWGVGFGWFLYRASHEAPPVAHADAIVALTGGPDRVEVALRLLAVAAAERLLISEAGEKTDLDALAHRSGIDPAPLEQQITLGYAAHSTRGNARETASWVHDHHVHSIMVVTAWFHMPRAMIELRRAMPTVTASPYPVGELSLASLRRSGMVRRVIGEYHKYLASVIGLTARWFAIETLGMEPAG